MRNDTKLPTRYNDAPCILNALARLERDARGTGLTGPGRALQLGTQTATVVVQGVRSGLVAGRLGVTASRTGQGLSVAGKVLGGVGAGLAVGVAIYGWSSRKPNQKLVWAA